MLKMIPIIVAVMVSLGTMVYLAEDVTEDGLVFDVDHIVPLKDTRPLMPKVMTECDGNNKVYMYNGNIFVVKEDASCPQNTL